MNTHSILGLLKTLLLFCCLRVRFIKADTDKPVVMEDGAHFRIFRHVKIKAPGAERPKAVFIVRFCPRDMTVQQNIRFSLLPMMVFMGFRGFREKYWCVNDETGLCQGVYGWQTMEDAENYSKSIAMRFMANRSDPESLSFKIISQEQEPYRLFQ